MTPVFFDFETQSAVDLPVAGGRNYAKHSSTRILCLTALIDDVFHVWIPGQDIELPCFRDLWPKQYGEARPIALWNGSGLPSAISDATVDRVFVAHNSDQFDELVWREKLDPIPQFDDSIHRARAGGYPAGLDEIGKRLFGIGKDAGNAMMRKLMTLTWADEQWRNPHTLPGNVATVARYNIADVIILERLWGKVERFSEPSVVGVHRTVNERGIRFDDELALALVSFGDRATEDAIKKVDELTKGEINRLNIKSIPQMKAFVLKHGIDLPNLRKETVERFMNDPESFLQEIEDEQDYHDYDD